MTTPTPPRANENESFIRCWTEILVPKWLRFRHILSGNGKVHSDQAYALFGIAEGERVIDVGCGFGETSLEMGEMVGPTGEVMGLDCTQAFLNIAEQERKAAEVSNVSYMTGDAQICDVDKTAYYDVLYSRFGVMFFMSAVAALRNVSKALKPGGRVCLIVWRNLSENPCWNMPREVALQYLPPPGDDKETCGPGPFSWGGEQTDRAMMKAAGYPELALFQQVDGDAFMGRTVEEAIDFQILVGPSGEIIREAGEEGQRQLPKIRDHLAKRLRPYLRDDGVYLPSSSWAIMARKLG